jgi:hypothetical protein
MHSMPYSWGDCGTQTTQTWHDWSYTLTHSFDVKYFVSFNFYDLHQFR